ncbi:MAG TPA: FAD-dependent oxidoreductase, partial [Thermoleophilia bacterium]|nr:FAD-dependent oxidoreductase [Thermoleophilia bacterium]
MADAGGHITEEARTVPVLCRTDVLVAGGGPGGLAAAVAAARAGARTVLVERHGCFGGVITQTGVETVAWYRRAGTVDLEGIGREFERRAEALDGATPDVQSQSLALDSELFKVVADRMVLEAGVEPLLHCLVTEPIVSGGV